MARNDNGFRGMLNAKGAAAHLGIHPSTFRKLINKKHKVPLPHYKMGDKRFFKAEDLNQWIEYFRV